MKGKERLSNFFGILSIGTIGGISIYYLVSLGNFGLSYGVLGLGYYGVSKLYKKIRH